MDEEVIIKDILSGIDTVPEMFEKHLIHTDIIIRNRYMAKVHKIIKRSDRIYENGKKKLSNGYFATRYTVMIDKEVVE